MPEPQPLIRELIAWGRRYGRFVALIGLVGAAGGGLVAALMPARFIATGYLRVAAIDGEPVVAATTAAFEMALPSFAARLRQQTGLALEITSNALHKTDLVQVDAVADSSADAARVVDVAVRLMVDDLNNLLVTMRADAFAPLREQPGPIYMQPLLVRPAIRIEPPAGPRPYGLPPAALVAFGLGAGLALGALLAAGREALRGV